MARRGGQSGGPRPRPGVYSIYEDFRPLSEWKYGEGQQSHFLLVHLPGFAKEQIKVSTEGTNTLRIRGERLVGGNKWSRFEEDFRIPDDCIIRGIRAKFESGTLTITMPKKGHTTTTQVSPIKEETQRAHFDAPLKEHTTTTQVSPKKEETQRPHLEAPLKVPDNEKGPSKTEQEIKEKIGLKVVEEVKESKKDGDVKEDSGKKSKEEVGNEKLLFKPESYFIKSEKKDEEKNQEVREKDNEKSKEAMDRLGIGKEIEGENEGVGKGKGSLIYAEKIEKRVKETSGEVKEKVKEKYKEVAEGFNIGKDTKEKGSTAKPENYFEKIEKRVKETSGEVKEKAKEKYKEVVEGFNTDNKATEDGNGKGLFRSEKRIEKVEMQAKEGTSRRGKENVKEKYKEVVKGMDKGDLEEERQLMVNMGVAVLVIVAFGAYLTYGLGSYGKAKA